MDTIRFEIYKRLDEECGNEIRVSIMINGLDLRDMIHDIEFQAANGDEERRDWYGDLCPRELKEELDEYRTPTVLGCTCGVKDCGPLTVLVTELKKRVIWSGFRHSPKRRYPVDYSELEFEFDKEQYNSEVERLNRSYKLSDKLPIKRIESSSEPECDDWLLNNKDIQDFMNKH